MAQQQTRSEYKMRSLCSGRVRGRKATPAKSAYNKAREIDLVPLERPRASINPRKLHQQPCGSLGGRLTHGYNKGSTSSF